MLQNGTLLQNRYLIERPIGQGGMGAVYLAVDQKFSTSNRVAIKETFYETPELADAFVREARLLNSLHHPILPHVSDYFSEDGRSFLVMEYIEGEDLSEILKRKGVFPLADVMRWTQEMLDGLDYLHSQEPPVVHRDIKPNNLKLTSRGHIVLLDFGLAKETDDINHTDRSIFGYSRRYSPLEQIEGVGSDARSDIFSLGATVYQLATGQPPIDALARASAIVAGQPDPLQLANEINSDIPDSVAHVIHSALALNAEHRFATARAMGSAIEYALDPESAPAKIDSDVVTASVAETSPTTVAAFPALQAFKAEIEHDAPPHELYHLEYFDDVPVHQTPRADVQQTDTAAVAKTFVPFAAGPDRGPSRAWQNGAVWLSFILVGLLGVGYGISRYESSDEALPAQTESASALLPTDQPIAESGSTASDVLEPEKVARETKNRSAKTVAEAKSTVTADAEKKTAVATPIRNPASTRNTAHDRPRVVERPSEQAPVSSIENVFTGIWGEDRRGRRPRWEVRVQEEEELRRERRRARREYRQRDDWPY